MGKDLKYKKNWISNYQMGTECFVVLTHFYFNWAINQHCFNWAINHHWYEPSLVRTIIGMNHHWYEPSLVRTIIGKNHHW